MLTTRRAKRPCIRCQSLLQPFIEPSLCHPRRQFANLQPRNLTRRPIVSPRQFSSTPARRREQDDNNNEVKPKAPIEADVPDSEASPPAQDVSSSSTEQPDIPVLPRQTDEVAGRRRVEVSPGKYVEHSTETLRKITPDGLDRSPTDASGHEATEQQGSKEGVEGGAALTGTIEGVEEEAEYEEDMEEDMEEEVEVNIPPFEDHSNVVETDPEKVVRSAKNMFRDTLPKDYLNEQELEIYRRLYGEPLRETAPADVGMPAPDKIEIRQAMKAEIGQNQLYKDADGGELEEVEYQMAEDQIPTESPQTALEQLAPPGEPKMPNAMEQLLFIHASAKNTREYNALLKLQEDFEVSAREEIKDEQEERARQLEEDGTAEQKKKDEEWDDVESYKAKEGPEEENVGPGVDPLPAETKLHPWTALGKFGTHPKTVHLGKENIVLPITDLLKRTHPKHVREAAERELGGPGLPHSPATRRDKHSMFPQLPVGLDPTRRDMTDIEADAHLATVFPFNYATTLGVLTEVRKRMGSQWIRRLMKSDDGQGPKVLDMGSGGAGAMAFQDIYQAEWDLRRAEGQVKSLKPIHNGKKTVIVGSDALRHRISRFLDDTTFLPRVPDYVHSQDTARHVDAGGGQQSRKVYDVIISTHTFMQYSPAISKRETWRRRFNLDNFWSLLNPNGGVLIIIEKGHPRGFEEVADARHRLLEEFIYTTEIPADDKVIEVEHRRKREPGRIIAPCTTHHHCPMYKMPGYTPGRKDFCHFKQRFIRPHFLQRLLNAKHFNHEDVQFSYVAVERGNTPIPAIPTGKDATVQAAQGYANSATPPDPMNLPRAIMPPLKRTKHVTLDLCTPEGNIERWVVPKSYGKQAYYDARKARWGDLWALGAKTRTHRTVRLGKKTSLEEAMTTRVYQVEKEFDNEGKERKIVSPNVAKTLEANKKRKEEKAKRKKRIVEVPRTSRNNRKAEYAKRLREYESAGSSVHQRGLLGERGPLDRDGEYSPKRPTDPPSQ